MAHFFETVTTPTGETRIQIGTRQLSPHDCICLLQTILIKKDAINADQKYQDILNKAKKILSKTGADSVQKIVDPLYQKLQILLHLLISMEDGSPLPNVSWSEVDNRLMELNVAMKAVFKQHALKIKMLHYVLVPFFQSCFSDARTKKVIARALTEASCQPILGQMLANEYDDCGVSVPVVVPDNVGYVSVETLDPSIVDATLEKIAVIERIAIEQSGDETLHYLRDLAYLQVLSTEDFYYHDPHLPTSKRVCRLSTLSVDELAQLVCIVMQSSHHPNENPLMQHRRLLQMLAIMHELYRNITGNRLTDKEWASILLALQQSTFELQWQLDVHKTSPRALLLYASLLCLRGDRVHIEQAERLLGLQDSTHPHRIFLARLNIVYLENVQSAGPRLGVLHLQKHASEGRTYYFGSQAIRFSNHPARNLYLAQGLCEIKQHALQVFDTWYGLFHTKPDLNAILQTERETLLHGIERAWVGYIAQHISCVDLQQIDGMIQQFQIDILPPIWQTTARRLADLAAKQVLSSTEVKRLEFLRQQPVRIAQPQARRYSVVPSTLLDYAEGGKHLSQARLHYDINDLSLEERVHWIQRYLRHHLLHLHRLCPHVEKLPLPNEQFEKFIEYLSAQCQQNTCSAELFAAMRLCVDIYHCMETMLAWNNPETIRNHIALLSTISSAHVLQTISHRLLSQIDWVTQTNSFYYRWLESNTVKQAAHKMYDLAHRVGDEPANRDVLQAWIQTLFEQHTILSKLWWYSPFAWLFGYADLRKVCADTLQKLHQMVTLHQIPQDVWQEAYEAAYCAPAMRTLQTALLRVRPCDEQTRAWQDVLHEIQTIQAQHTGFAMMYELEAYLQTQRQKFVIYRSGMLYGSWQIDPIVPLLRILHQTRCDIEKTTQHAVVAKNFLAKKARQIQVQRLPERDVSISPGYFTDYFFDIEMRSKQGETRSRRFYHLNDFFAFTRKVEVGEEVLNDKYPYAI